MAINNSVIPPRVLVISNNCFSKIFNNGKTFEALFSAFPKENLAQIYFHEGFQPDFTFCDNYWKVSEIDLIRGIFRKKGGVGQQLQTSTFSNTPERNSGYPRVLRYLKEKTGNITRDLLWKILDWESPELYKWISDFNPNVLFFVGSSAVFSSMVALKISSKIALPLAVYYTDDYLFSLPQNTLIQKNKYRGIKKLYKKVVDEASLHFAIGELMAQEYSVFFNRRFFPVMNSVEVVSYEPIVENNELVLSYFGGLHLNRWKMLVRLASLLPKNSKVQVYTAPGNINFTIKKEFDRVGIEYKGLLSGEELKIAMENSDILLHVESDDVDNRRFTRLAISTKLPEYLISGRPVLGFGPIEVASMKLLSDNGVGMVINSDDDDNIIEVELNAFVGDFEKRKDLALKGYNFAVKSFNEETNSVFLMKRLSEIVNK